MVLYTHIERNNLEIKLMNTMTCTVYLRNSGNLSIYVNDQVFWLLADDNTADRFLKNLSVERKKEIDDNKEIIIDVSATIVEAWENYNNYMFY